MSCGFFSVFSIHMFWHDITELFTNWWTHDQSQQSNLSQFYYNFESYFVESGHVFVNQYGIIKGQFKNAQSNYFTIFSFYTFDMPILAVHI